MQLNGIYKPGRGCGCGCGCGCGLARAGTGWHWHVRVGVGMQVRSHAQAGIGVLMYVRVCGRVGLCGCRYGYWGVHRGVQAEGCRQRGAGRGVQAGMCICVGRHGGWGMHLLRNDLCLWRWVCVAVWGMQLGTVGF